MLTRTIKLTHAGDLGQTINLNWPKFLKGC